MGTTEVGPPGRQEAPRRDLERRGRRARPRRGDRLQAANGAKYPKAVAKIVDDLDELLAFYDYPAKHWVHLRTTNPIESTFATVRHRTKVTKRPGSRAAAVGVDGGCHHDVHVADAPALARLLSGPARKSFRGQWLR
ncbi:hypothetical protein HD597_000326 [Nonomuraea thailandensis]|uniref:Mutator family transposase n=1 Tax=Nonomuraea thailandensis TaxID=1188745 RepID=A0A9X2K1A1_9ACTN|nr:hypothetical protein [Nonomuraea thailandensis]